MSLYQRGGGTWWYTFRFAGSVFRESTKTSIKALAEQVERKRHQQLNARKRAVTKLLAAGATIRDVAAQTETPMDTVEQWASVKKKAKRKKGGRR